MMRALDQQEMEMVSGGEDVIVVRGTRPQATDGATVITPDMWQSRGMTAHEFIFGEAHSLSFEPTTFALGPAQDRTEYTGVRVNVDHDGDGQTDYSVDFGVEDSGDGQFGDGIGAQVRIPF
jgi:hypothetical protein